MSTIARPRAVYDKQVRHPLDCDLEIAEGIVVCQCTGIVLPLYLEVFVEKLTQLPDSMKMRKKSRSEFPKPNYKHVTECSKKIVMVFVLSVVFLLSSISPLTEAFGYAVYLSQFSADMAGLCLSLTSPSEDKFNLLHSSHGLHIQAISQNCVCSFRHIHPHCNQSLNNCVEKSN